MARFLFASNGEEVGASAPGLTPHLIPFCLAVAPAEQPSMVWHLTVAESESLFGLNMQHVLQQQCGVGCGGWLLQAAQCYCCYGPSIATVLKQQCSQPLVGVAGISVP